MAITTLYTRLARYYRVAIDILLGLQILVSALLLINAISYGQLRWYIVLAMLIGVWLAVKWHSSIVMVCDKVIKKMNINKKN